VAANPLAVALGAPTDRSGRVMVQPDLSLSGHSEVFVIGDMAAITDEHGCPVPGISPAAIQMGEHVARTIATSLRRAAPPARQPFVYRDKGTMATIGRSRAVARIGGFEFSGPVAWLLWLLVHLLFLIGFRNKLSVLVQWAYAYVTYKPGARVIYGQPGASAPHPPVNINGALLPFIPPHEHANRS
jgi:NADH:ubiquinone reductase (H+-translocating)